MTSDKNGTNRGKISKMIFLLLAWGLVACIGIQTYIAGSAVFQNPVNWKYHVNFVHVFEFIPLLMIVFANTGRLFKGSGWLSLVLFVLIYSQYVTGNLPLLGAFHPVMAMVLIVLSLHVALRASRSWKPSSSRRRG